MLDFYFIRNGQPNNMPVSQLNYAGGITEEDFELAQAAGIIESRFDYYSDFRWSSEQVQSKVELLQKSAGHFAYLFDILKQAKAANCGLSAFGD